MAFDPRDRLRLTFVATFGFELRTISVDTLLVTLYFCYTALVAAAMLVYVHCMLDCRFYHKLSLLVEYMYN